jgi:DNA-binding transcriptional regulator YhcF (GntR family)
MWYNRSVDLLLVDLALDVPPFEQVQRQIVRQVEVGSLEVGDRLPPVRRLAKELGLAANTVAKSYRQLESAGVVETRGRHGTFVAGTNSARYGQAAQATREFVRRMRDLKISESEVLEMLRGELESGRRATDLGVVVTEVPPIAPGDAVG